MLNQLACSTAAAYWASHLGCSPVELFNKRFRLLTHGAELADYAGAFALFRGDAGVASVPPDRLVTLKKLLSHLAEGSSPETFASALGSLATAIVGPAYIGYAMSVSPPAHPAESLGSEHTAALADLRDSCDPTEWEHGGGACDQPASGVFVGRQLVALATYEVWGGTIAHLSIITHPAFRGRGHGRTAVAHLAARALRERLLPQYRTLQANRPSIRIAESLGFHPYATSMAARFNGHGG